MSEIKLAIEKLKELAWISEPNQKLEINDIISLLRQGKNDDLNNYDDRTKNHILNLLVAFDQNPITSNFNQFLKWRYKK